MKALLPIPLVAAGCGAYPTDNFAPLALLDYDRRVSVGATVELDGRKSVDPNGDLLLYTWTLAEKPAGSGAMIAEDGATAQLEIDLGGTYAVEMSVSDGRLSDGDRAVLTTSTRRPIALVGPDVRVPVGTPVRLDGTASWDPDGDRLTYRWILVQFPSNTTAFLSDPTSPQPVFTPDLEGRFTFDLTVSDGFEESDDAARTSILAGSIGNREPVASISVPASVEVGTTVLIDGNDSMDPDGDRLAYEWRLRYEPDGSRARIADDNEEVAELVPDVAGEYGIELILSDGFTSVRANAMFVATLATTPATVEPLPFGVIDAEWSEALDLLVAVSETPPRLHLYDPRTRTSSSVDLPVTPSSVSVAPPPAAGAPIAVVGHDGFITVVDLAARSVVKSIPVSLPVGDVVAAGNGFAYATSAGNRDDFRSVDLAIDVESPLPIFSGRDASRIKLHAGGAALYGADRGTSPDDIMRYDISAGVASYVDDSPYHGDYDVCGDLWLTRDGARILTACGNSFRASDVADRDMRYGGSIEGEDPRELLHAEHSPAAGLIAAVFGRSWQSSTPDDARFVRLFDDQFLGLEREIVLPIDAAQGTPWRGRYAFFTNDGRSLFVLLQEDEQAGGLAWAVARY
jgi:hypothetical protein